MKTPGRRNGEVSLDSLNKIYGTLLLKVIYCVRVDWEAGVPKAFIKVHLVITSLHFARVQIITTLKIFGRTGRIGEFTDPFL